MLGTSGWVRRFVGGLTLAGLFLSGSAGAEPGPAPPPERIELRHDLRVDLSATAAAGAGLLVYDLWLRDELLPKECRLCDGASVNAFDSWFRDNLRRTDVTPARTLSDVLSVGVAPLTIAALSTLAASDHESLRDAPTDVALIAEGVMASLVVSEALRSVVLRERPDYHALSAEEKARYAQSDEPLLSFPAGHGGTVLAMTAAAGTIAAYRGYRLSPLIWAAGLLMTAATSYMRIAADRSYLTDEIAGWAVGAVVGGGVPWLFHRPVHQTSSSAIVRTLRGARPSTYALEGGRAFTMTWAF